LILRFYAFHAFVCGKIKGSGSQDRIVNATHPPPARTRGDEIRRANRSINSVIFNFI
jgi:hypothetical protein